MKKSLLPLIAVCLAVSACDLIKRDGTVTLTGGSPIPLNDRNGSRAELVAGPAEVRVKKGDASGTIDIRVRQPGRNEINFSAAVSGDVRSGNFTLRGSEIGQPVDLTSARSYVITGRPQRYSTIEETGFQRCMVDVTYDPCDENWNVTFRSGSGAELGSFASRSAERCNERRGFPYNCHRVHEPRIPDHPRGPRGMNGGGIYQGAMELGAEKVSFDGR
jgi:hypothetical protein